MPGICCGTCKFFQIHEETDLGDCRRFPPIFAGETAAFPVVQADRWCGEWKTAGSTRKKPEKSTDFSAKPAEEPL